jgi:hypothetical protein
MVDARSDANPVPISTFPAPPSDAFAKRGGRCGAHNRVLKAVRKAALQCGLKIKMPEVSA